MSSLGRPASSSAPRRISTPKRPCPASSRRRRRRSPRRWRKAPASAWGAWSENGKFGPPELPVGTLARLADYVIVEADGAKRLPLKAHAAHEPVIPPEANQTILVVGASGFGRPMYETVHRAPLAAQALGVPEDTVVTPALWAQFLEHEHLHTRVLVNQADLPQGRELARRLAAGLCCPVCAAALQKEWIECLS